jgi:pyruvate formate lyase activating enzyme
MRIAGIQKNSFVDYPGRIAAVIFTAGCNLDCYYCHNRQLIDYKQKEVYSREEVLELLEKRKRFLEGVVISGGEPTLQPDLCSFMLELKAMGYNVKLDTNGTNPSVVKELVHEKAVDYLAMDIKAPLHMYDNICRVDVDTGAILKSVEFIMGSGIEYEFRTTVAPQLKPEHIVEIASTIIKGARMYVLQQYRRPQTVGSKTDGNVNGIITDGNANGIITDSNANGIINEEETGTINSKESNKASSKESGMTGSKESGIKGSKENSKRIIDIRNMQAPYSKLEIEKMADAAREYVQECRIRGV